MEQYKKILGKVMMTAEGIYNKDKKYEPISLVTDEETDKSYISRKEVPAGTQINNREFWQPVASSGIIDNGVIILNRKNSDGQIPIYDLKSATEAVAIGDRRGGVILGFLGFNPETDTVPTWKLYQYNDVSPSNWTNIDYWLPMDYTNKYAGWFDNEEALYDSVPFPKVGMYAYVGNSATSAIIYRCYVDRTWQATEDKAFGGVVNLADEEDITSKQNKLKFKDKEYNPAQYNGMGRIYLRKNIVGGINVLTQTMMQATNTIYIIQYDYDLQGQTITIPEGCTLNFQGGSFSNGTIEGNNTVINSLLTRIFSLDIYLLNNWNTSYVFPEWFGSKGDGVSDDTLTIQKSIEIATLISKPVYFSKIYNITNTINVTVSTYFSENSSLKHSSEKVLFHIKSNWSKHYNISIYKDNYELNDTECAIFIDAYNVTLYSPFVSRSNCGIAFNQFHTDIISPRIYDCNYGIIASAKGDNAQINLCRVFGGVLSSIKEYAIYLGGYEQKFDFLPIQTSVNVIHGSSISFFGTQIMGTAFVSNVGNVNFIGNEFEEAGYGKGIGLEIGKRVQGLHLENAYFNGYNYCINYIDTSKETSNVSIKNIIADNVKFCVVYCYNAGGFDVNIHNIKCLNGKPELHLGTAFNTTGGYNYYNTDKLTKGNLKYEITKVDKWVYPKHKYVINEENVISSHNEYILRLEEKNDIYPVSINTYNITVPKEHIYEFVPNQQIQVYYANTYRDLFIHKIDYINNIITVNINIQQYGVDMSKSIKCPKADFVLSNVTKSYNFDSRPNNIKAGDNIFDTTLNKPIWWTGSKWIDATGAEV